MVSHQLRPPDHTGSDPDSDRAAELGRGHSGSAIPLEDPFSGLWVQTPLGRRPTLGADAAASLRGQLPTRPEQLPEGVSLHYQEGVASVGPGPSPDRLPDPAPKSEASASF